MMAPWVEVCKLSFDVGKGFAHKKARLTKVPFL